MPFGAQFCKIQTQEPEHITNLHCQFKKQTQNLPPNQTKPKKKPPPTDTSILRLIKNISSIIMNSKKRERKFLLYHIISSSKYVTYKIMLKEEVNPLTGKYKQAN